MAFWLWGRLRVAYPDAHACVLMGNHLHLVVPERPRPRQALASLVGRAFRADPIPPAQRVEGRRKQLRLIRYVYLNPVRARLTTDPLGWLFSTLRDDVGAVHEPWTRNRPGLLTYVQKHDLGRPRPLQGPAVDRDVALVPLGDCVRAVRVSLRRRDLDSELARRMFVHLAGRQGWTSTKQLAATLGVTTRAVQLARHRPDPSATARLCLANEALLRPLLPSRPEGAEREVRRWTSVR